jgi:TRAP-type transport system periplasmic protein
MLSVTDYGQLSQFVPDMAVVAGPYMFSSPDDAKKLFASPVFKDLSTRLEQQGLKLIMADGLFGVRHLLSGKPVRSPADIAGLTLRVPPSPIMLETFTALGARPQAPWAPVRRRCPGARSTTRCRPAWSMPPRPTTARSPAPSSTRCARWSPTPRTR